jgi:hypothetical protein
VEIAAFHVEEIRDSKEVGDELGLRSLVHIPRRSTLDDLATTHHGEAIGELERLLLVVSDEDEGDPNFALNRDQLLAQRLAQLRVERAERLVEQQNRGPQDEGTREGDPLLLTAGELSRAALSKRGQPDQLQGGTNPRPAL